MIVAIVSAALAGTAACPAVPAPAVEAALRAADTRWARANATGDVRALEALFHPSLIVISGSGTVRTRAEELEEVRPNPNFRVEYFRTSEVSVRLCGRTALVVGIAEWRLVHARGATDHRRRYTSVYARGSGRWRMIHLQISGPFRTTPSLAPRRPGRVCSTSRHAGREAVQARSL